jgi:flavin reductase (DIM6/NTAB) family NADH-FMN oxidoreductase RutF
MLVVTAAAGGERAGCLVGFATQCSIEPARLMVCLSQRNRTYRVALLTDTLAAHYLSRDHLELARLFGEETGDDVDKFARCQWSPGPAGTPILSGVRGWVAGPVLERFDVGDHTAFLVEPMAGEVGDDSGPPLGFQQVRGFDPGHEP